MARMLLVKRPQQAGSLNFYAARQTTEERPAVITGAVNHILFIYFRFTSSIARGLMHFHYNGTYTLL